MGNVIGKDGSGIGGRGLSDELYGELVDTLYGHMSSLLSGAIGGTLCAGFTAWATGSVTLAWLTVVIAYVGACRIILTGYYRKRDRGAGRVSTRRWELSYGIGAWIFAFLLGLVCWFAITGTEEGGVHLLVAAFTLGYTAGVAGRNAARPALVSLQVVLATLPLAAALLSVGGAAYNTLAAMLLLNFFSVRGIAVTIHATLARALEATHHAGQLAAELTQRNRMFDVSLASMSHGICIVDGAGAMKVWNNRFLDILAVDPAGVEAGMPLARLVSAQVVQTPGGTASRLETMEAFSLSLKGNGRSTVDLAFRNGAFGLLTFDPLPEGGMVVVLEDASERRRVEAELSHMARYDSLTDLPNRGTLPESVRAVTSGLSPRGAVLLVDLDHFKRVNDTLGHPVGDMILIEVARRLREALGPNASLCRFGGDEFAVVIDGCRNPESAQAIAEDLIAAVSDIYDVDETQVVIGATVGIAMIPEDGLAVDALMKKADMALYAAKDKGRGTSRFFERGMDVEAAERRKTDVDLRRALSQGQIEVHYQPLYSLADRRISACEALVRWRHPERGMISPAEFVPIAEETGTICQIGEWVLNEACRVATGWPRDIRIAVNLSPVQFHFPGLVDAVRSALTTSGLEPSRLELEITESVLIKDPDSTLGTLNELRALGVRISLDDFGTGYSSLGYLRKFPFSKVKVDRSFVMDITDPASSNAIIRAVALIASDFGMTVTAEGIETEAQLRSVVRDGCTEGQGYLLDRPLPEQAVNERIASEAARLAA